jgi:hypothetical protein
VSNDYGDKNQIRNKLRVPNRADEILFHRFDKEIFYQEPKLLRKPIVDNPAKKVGCKRQEPDF